MSLKVWHLVTFLVLFSAALADDCRNVSISLTQKVDNEGFHRKLNWLLERNEDSIDCELMIHLNVGTDMYINPDEIGDLHNLLIDGDVDMEAPAHLATGHKAYYYVEPNAKVLISVPFHLRYQRGRISGGFGKVIVNKPSILARCPDDCHSQYDKKKPCNALNEHQCSWRNVTYQALFEEVELLVPIGNLDDYPIVSIVTLLLGCAGCIYTLSVLSTTPL